MDDASAHVSILLPEVSKCELLALCFNVPIRPTLSFRALPAGRLDNPNGRGVACYPDDNRSALVQ